MMPDERLQARLDELRREHQLGEVRLRELIQQETSLRETLLRISGAIQVLEELSGAGDDESDESPVPGRADDGARRGSQIQSVP
jgi:prefoldin subunit 5